VNDRANDDRAGRAPLLGRSWSARVILLTAPAGYGKTTLANALRAQYDRSGVCDCLESETPSAFAHAVLRALAQEDPSDAAFFADLQVRLSSAQSESEIANILDTAWGKNSSSALFVFENAEGVASSPAIAALLTRLLNTAPLTRRIVVCSRIPLPTRASRYLPPHQLSTVTAKELALNESQAKVLLERDGVDPRDWDRIIAAARGWPIVLLLLARISHEKRLEAALSDASGVAFEDLFVYLVHEVLAPLDPRVKQMMILCSAVPQLTAEELRGAIDCTELELESMLRTATLIRRDEEYYRVHPLVRQVLLQNEPGWRDAILPIAHFALEQGDYHRAGQLFRLAGRDDEAAAALSRLSMDELQTPRSVNELLQLPLASLRKHANLVAVSITTLRSDFMKEPAVIREVFERLTEDDCPDVIAEVAVAYSTARYNRDGDMVAATQILHAPLVERAAKTAPSARALLAGQEQIIAFNFAASSSVEKALQEAYGLAAAAGLHHSGSMLADSLAGVCVWSGNRDCGRQWLELSLNHARSCAPRIHAGMLFSAIFYAWVMGDDSAVAGYREELADAAERTHNLDYSTILRALDPQTIESALPNLWESTLARRALMMAASTSAGRRDVPESWEHCSSRAQPQIRSRAPRSAIKP
jgi:AAA domain